MEENTRQQQLTFEKGITNVPSDAMCSDNALEESVGMVYDNGEHRVIQTPTVKFSGVPGRIVYIHKFNDVTRYIHLVEAQEQSGQQYVTVYDLKVSTDGVSAEWLTRLARTSRFETGDITVTSIGKTLIVSEQGRPLTYYLWNDETGGAAYVNIGPLPDPTVRFWLEGSDERFVPESVPDHYKDELDFCVYSSGSSVGIIADNNMDVANDNIVINSGAQEEYNNLAVGLYAKNMKAVAQKKGFALPFFVRYALEMYDGTYTHISNPVLLFPCVTRNSYSIYYEKESLMTFTRYCRLKYSIASNGLENFSDVVKDIVVFVSSGIGIYDTSLSQPFSRAFDQYTTSTTIGSTMYYAPYPDPVMETDGIFRVGSDTYSDYHGMLHDYVWAQDGTIRFVKFDTLKQKPVDEIISGIKGTSVFYKLCEIGMKSVAKGDVAEKIETHTLENLTTQESLEADDWFSRSQLIPGFMHAYNSRLNLANVRRTFFLGFSHFLSYDNAPASPEKTYEIAVRIKGETKEYHICKSQVETNEKLGFYFYYPDARADHVWIRQNGTEVLNADLEEHAGLNGAFYLDKSLPGYNNHTSPASPSHAAWPASLIDNDGLEVLANHVIQSEVSNPWVFKAEGYHKVGTGRIIGMSTVTQALSQGQFGQYPLLVFSESGIWAMSVGGTGAYQSIHPMSREVCNNAQSITQTDGAVFFTSEKGLMVVVGSEVKCASEQLSGRESDFTGEVQMGNLRDYLRSCFIAYDYRDSLLWIFNSSRQQNTDYCYVYSIKSGTFGKYRFAQAVGSVVNDYPDTLLQAGTTLYTLTGRPNINLDSTQYTALMITRPMKLEDATALKSIMQVRHIGDMQGTLSLRIYASNNLKTAADTWAELRSLRGMPWKYYRFRFDLSQMKATDRYAGSIIITQTRRTNKLR